MYNKTVGFRLLQFYSGSFRGRSWRWFMKGAIDVGAIGVMAIDVGAIVAVLGVEVGVGSG